MGCLWRACLQEMRAEEVVCEPEAMDSEDPLFLLYTSGSTGKPKALVHTQAGYLLYAALTHRVKLAPSGPGGLRLRPGRLTAALIVTFPLPRWINSRLFPCRSSSI